MSNPILRQLNPLFKILIFVMFAITSAGIVGGISMALAVVIQGISFAELQFMLENVTRENAPTILLLNTLSIHIGLFLVPCIIFIVLFGKKAVNSFWLKRIGWKFILVVLAMIFAMPLIELAIHFNAWIIPENSWLEAMFKPSEAKLENLTKDLMYMPNWSSYIRNVLLVAIIPAVTEELVFRGVVQSQIAKHTSNIHLAIWFSAFLFSFIHMQFYGFIPRMLLGAFFGYLVIWTGSMYAAILAHFINNFISVSLEFYAQGEQTLSVDEIESAGVNWGTILVALVLFTLTVRYLLKFTKWPSIKAAYLNNDDEVPYNPIVLDDPNEKPDNPDLQD